MSTPKKCCERIFRDFHFWSCSNNGRVNREGKWFCLIHDPVAVKARDDKTRARWIAERVDDAARYEAQWVIQKRTELCVAACEGISDVDVKRLTALNRCDIRAFIAQNL